MEIKSSADGRALEETVESERAQVAITREEVNIPIARIIESIGAEASERSLLVSQYRNICA